MANNNRHHHIFLEGFTESEVFRPPRTGRSSLEVAPQDRRQHGARLRSQLRDVKEAAVSVKKAQREAKVIDQRGILVEFESFPDIELAFEKLDRKRPGIELRNFRRQDNLTYATVFVPDGKLDHFETLIRDYLKEKKNKSGSPRDNRLLLDTINNIRDATLKALWTDDAEFPTNSNKPIWWEVWLSLRKKSFKTTQEFRKLAASRNIFVQPGDLVFPERIVLLAKASLELMQKSLPILNSIAELRYPRETAEFFDSLPPTEQEKSLIGLLSRTKFVSDGSNIPYVCLLDTGVNRGHNLISPALDSVDMYTVEPGWGTDDSKGHGTQMAGLSLFGDMTALLTNNDTVEIRHRLESVKLLPEDGVTGTDPHHHGHLTVEAVARPEINFPERARIFGMPITARDNRDRGQPSAWSSALDQLASNADSDGQNPRLLIVAAGNIEDLKAIAEYPTSNQSDGIHDPAQAWNVLTVGACTDLVRVAGDNSDNYKPIADKGGLSPFSTTSLAWQQRWPMKPDVVFEGGNAAKDSLGAVSMPSLSLLTTHHLPADRAFIPTNATSAATALASRMAAQIMVEYTQLWPETVRALIVHSAEWTASMERNYLSRGNQSPKNEFAQLIRRCGFGKPDLERALWSVENSLTMVKQDSLQPFKKEKGENPSLNEMNLHKLPWPIEALLDLGEEKVEMRVTLSYFIEPNPSARGVRSRYRYESHGLRFDIKRPIETVREFLRRVNQIAKEETSESSGSRGDHGWLIGKNGRHKGSLHGDIWRGNAADLAERGCFAVFPTTGWWKTRPALKQYDKEARYSLVVSIKAPEVDVDLYTEVENQVSVAIEG